jgi:phosphatidylserine/phosphatidylglycerophosphate/cardiolipin synthase-like enzyme
MQKMERHFIPYIKRETTHSPSTRQPHTVGLSIALLLFFISPHAFSQDIPAQNIPAGATFELGFSPGGTSLAVVLHGINAAQNTLYVACYEFTSRPIAEALIAAMHRGVQVAVVADHKASLERYSLIPFLIENDIPVRRDSRYSIEHQKYMVIDSEDVETGSFNYTDGAVKHNAENALLLWHVPNIAAEYAHEWKRLWNESR